jgi:CheY-like chemotaxis protein
VKHFNILLVDDSAGDARLFEIALREVAPRVTLYWVASGDEAIEALRRGDRFKDIAGFDVIILDLNMPGNGGFDILGRIRGDAEMRIRPVLVMSSSRDPRDVRRSYELGASSYFVKPLTLDGIQDVCQVIARYWLELAELPPVA